MEKNKIKFNFFINFIIFSIIFEQNFVLSQSESQKRFFWSAWGQWNHCSRTCGIGIQSRSRTCFDKYTLNSKVSEYYCDGSNFDHKTCNNQPCPRDSIDFRTYQCEEFSQKRNWGGNYQWRPFLDGGLTCNLLCMPKGFNFYRELAEKVVDGTRCGYDLNGICANGECMTIGCDGQLNSTKTYDKCGKCDGDNLSCNLISGLYADNHLEKGYHTIAIFPKGAKNINITEMESSDNYLALKTESGRDILNSNSEIQYSSVFQALGTEISYFRRRIIANKDAGEAIFIKGPINETVILQLLYYYHNPGVIYYYSLDFAKPDATISKDTNRAKLQNYILKEDIQNPNNYLNKKPSLIGSPTINNNKSLPPTKKPITTSSSPKAVINFNNEQIVVLSNKKTLNNSASRQNKNYTPEQRRFQIQSSNKTGRFMWFIAGQSLCSATCGGGVRQEIIKCLDRSQGKIVHPRYCRPELKPEARNITCNLVACLPSWDVSDWSPCSSTCGSGVQYRSLKCIQKISPVLSNELLKEACQQLPIPDLKRTCYNKCTYWKTGKWQNCQVTCGRGGKTRDVFCVNEFETPIDEAMCNLTKPTTVEICDMGSCAKVWFYSNWSSTCESKCEKDSYITRKVVCGAKLSLTQNDTSEDEYCNPRQMPESRRTCRNNLNKCQAKWFIGPWSECSASCNEGFRKRSIICFIETKNKWVQTEESFCNPKEKPESTEKCVNEPCKAEWYTSDWSECSKTCGTGVRTREVKCINENNQASMDCDSEMKPYTREACKYQDCPLGEEQIRKIDPNCKDDNDNNCDLIKRSNLCSIYKTRCCKTCR